MNTEEMSREERSLLLYLEARSTDNSGTLDNRNLNSDDMKILSSWKKSEFVDYGRICFEDIRGSESLWVKMSDEAIDLAHKERKARIKRTWNSKFWKSIEEKRNETTEESAS